MEQWDLYDITRKPIRKLHTRGVPIEKGYYHLVVSVLVISQKKQRILLTKRHPEKKSYPNLWEFTGGAVLAEESSKAGAVRELFEETGIKISEQELILLDMDKGNTAFWDTYVVLKDLEIEDIVFQEGETVAAKWISFNELMQIVEKQQIPGYLGQRVLRLQKEICDYVEGK